MFDSVENREKGKICEGIFRILGCMVEEIKNERSCKSLTHHLYHAI